jgi:hypothetical protein
MKFKRFVPLYLLFVLLMSLRAESKVQAATITVCATGCDHTSIQGAIGAAVAGDTISIAAGLYLGTITIDKNLTLDGAGAGSTIITTNPMSPTDEAAIVTVNSGVTAVIDGVTITGGHKANSGDPFNDGGGGLYNAGQLTLTNSTIRDNIATGSPSNPNAYGGGIFNLGTLTLIESTVRNNRAVGGNVDHSIIGGEAIGGSGHGGGIYNISGSLTLIKSTVSHNEASGGTGTGGAGGNGHGGGGAGGGIYTWAVVGGGGAAVTLVNSTVSGNQASGGTGISGGGDESVFGAGGSAAGGGIFNLGGLSGFDPLSSVHLSSSTIGNNSATGGDGIDSDGPDGQPQGGNGFGGGITSNLSATLVNSLVTNNSAGGGSAISNGIPGAGFGGGLDHGGAAFFQHAEYSIVAGNQPNDCRFPITSDGHNWESQTTCGFTDPSDQQDIGTSLSLLGPLADNGGPTLTHALTGSTPIDAGDNSTCPRTDQRGNLRPIDGLCDIGAFESGVNHAPVLHASGDATLAAINADEVDNNGTLVFDIIASVLPLNMITDANLRAEEGIAIIAVNNTNGIWQYIIPSDELGWTDLDNPSDSAAFLLVSDAEVRIRFVPNPGFCGTVNPGITFRAWDLLGDYSNNIGNTSTHGGNTPFSDMTETASITVNCVNSKIFLPIIFK